MTASSRVISKPPWGMTQIVRWFLVAQFGPLVLVLALVAVVFGDEGFPDSTPIWLLVVSSALIWVGYGVGTVVETIRTGAGPEVELGIKAPLWMYLVAAILGALTQVGLLPVLYWPILKLAPNLNVGGAAESLVADYDSVIEIAIFTLVAVVAAPIVEELFYRGLLLRGLTHYMHPAYSVVLSALIFAVIHFQLAQLPGLFMFGLIAGMIVYYTGRVGVSIVLHMAFNLTAVAGLFWI